MKKLFVLSFALLAALVACNKDEFVAESNDVPAASFTATIAPDSKVTFTSDGNATEGFTTKFDGNERVFIWTDNASNANDLYNLFQAGDHTDKSAKFDLSTNATYNFAIPSSPVNFGAWMTSYNCMGTLSNAPYLRFGYNSNKFLKRFDFRYGNGTLAQATKVQALYTSGTYNEAFPDLTFSFVTSILKVDVNLPAGTGATTENTKIYVKGTGLVSTAQVNSVTGAVKTDESGATPTVTITPDASVISGDNLVFYVPIWAGLSGVTIKNATIDVTVGDETYSIKLSDETGKNVVAGKTYTFKPASKLALKSIDKWVDDAAGSVTLAAGLTESASDGLTYNSSTGEVSWTANTTGKPAKKTITFTSGDSATITQISVDDFKGDWTFYAKTFAGQNKIGLVSNNTGSFDVNFGDPVGGVEKLYDEDTKLTLENNIGIRGLFGAKGAADAAVMNASLRLDRDQKIVEFYLFFDGRKAQATTTGDAAYPYVMFLPEFGKTFIGSPWDFSPFPLGTSQNYGYTEMSISADASKLTYASGNKWAWGNDGDKNGQYVIGISVNVSSSATPTTSTMRGANSNSTYEYIYQANYNTNVSTGFYFSR